MSFRSQTYVTLVAHATNVALRMGALDPEAANRKPGDTRKVELLDTTLGSVPMRVAVSDWRDDEIRISIAAWPTDDVDRWIRASNAKELAGEVTAHAYVARNKHGRLMITSPFDPVIFIRQSRRSNLAALPPASELDDPLVLHSACIH